MMLALKHLTVSLVNVRPALSSSRLSTLLDLPQSVAGSLAEWSHDLQLSFLQFGGLSPLEAVGTSIVGALGVSGLLVSTLRTREGHDAAAFGSIADGNTPRLSLFCSSYMNDSDDVKATGFATQRGAKNALAFPYYAVLKQNIPLVVHGSPEDVELHFLQLIEERVGKRFDDLEDFTTEIWESRGELPIPGCITNEPTVKGVRAVGIAAPEHWYQCYVVPLFDGSFLLVKPEFHDPDTHKLTFQHILQYPRSYTDETFFEDCSPHPTKKLEMTLLDMRRLATELDEPFI